MRDRGVASAGREVLFRRRPLGLGVLGELGELVRFVADVPDRSESEGEIRESSPEGSRAGYW